MEAPTDDSGDEGRQRLLERSKVHALVYTFAKPPGPHRQHVDGVEAERPEDFGAVTGLPATEPELPPVAGEPQEVALLADRARRRAELAAPTPLIGANEVGANKRLEEPGEWRKL